MAAPVRKEPKRREPEGSGGIPDGLLVGAIAFLLGTVVTAWLATGIGGLVQHGRWPGIAFSHTALALRHLVGKPTDIQGAWSRPHPVSGLPTAAVFWVTALLLVLVLITLAVLAISGWARFRDARGKRAAPRRQAPLPTGPEHRVGNGHRVGPEHRPGNGHQPADPQTLAVPSASPVPAVPAEAAPESATTPRTPQAADRPQQARTAPAAPLDASSGSSAPASPADTPRPGIPVPPPPTTAVPRPRPHPLSEDALVLRARAIRPEIPVIGRSLHDALAYGIRLGRDKDDGTELFGGLDQTYRVFGPPGSGRTTRLVHTAVARAPGPVLVTCDGPGTLQSTISVRSQNGPVAVFDPLQLSDTAQRVRWSPVEGCQDARTADARARALLEPVRPLARTLLSDSHTQQLAQTLLRCWLHAAALDRRPIRQVHRWSTGLGGRDAVKILRTAKDAAADWAGALEASLSGHQQQLDAARALTARALESLSQLHILNSCTPSSSERFSVEAFLAEQGTLYVVGEGIEDPRTRPGVMPLVTALVESVIEQGRRMAATSSSGRLDPPLLAALDDVATVAPVPGLPELMSLGGRVGIPAIAVFRSGEQVRHRWGDRGAAAIGQAADVHILMDAPDTAKIQLGDRSPVFTSDLCR